MALADYLCAETICTRLEAQQRDEAIRLLLEHLVACKLMESRLLDAALKAILDREKLGSTAIGKGVAVPHARMDGIEGVLVAFGFSRAGVQFNALDGGPAHLIFLVMGPKEGAEQYLDAMQHISRLVQNDDFRRFVARAKGVQDVMDLIREMDL